MSAVTSSRSSRARRSASSPTRCRAATSAASSRRPRCSPTPRRPTWCCGCSPPPARRASSGPCCPPTAWGWRAASTRALAKRRASEGRLPALEFVELDALTGTADDTRALVRAMRTRAAVIVTARRRRHRPRRRRRRAATSRCCRCRPAPTTPSRRCGRRRSPARPPALLATGPSTPTRSRTGRRRCTSTAGRAHEIALVDVCVSTVTHVGAKALWQPATLRELYCTFAEPHAIGLSSIAGLLQPPAADRPARRRGPLGDPAAARDGVRPDRARRRRRRSACARPRVAPGVPQRVAPPSAAPSPSTASARSRSDRARRHRHPRARRPPRARRACHPRRRRRAPAARPPAPASPPCRRSDEGSTVPRPRRHPDRRRTRAAPSGRGR